MKLSTTIFEDSAGNQLEHTRFGTGSKVLICFPGFGETLHTFSFLSDELIDYQIVAINLYFIKSSKKVNPHKPIQPIEWKETFDEFLNYLNVSRFSVLGFSLGGRFSTITFQFFQERMDHLILVAPDAIEMRLTYQIATFPIFFRQLFWLLMKFPKPFFTLIAILNRLHLVNRYSTKFALKYLHNKKMRHTLFQSWNRFKPLRVKQKELIKVLNSSTCESTIIFGKKDKIISPKRHLPFISKLTKTKVHTLPHGHNKLVNNAVILIVNTLQITV